MAASIREAQGPDHVLHRHDSGRPVNVSPTARVSTVISTILKVDASVDAPQDPPNSSQFCSISPPPRATTRRQVSTKLFLTRTISYNSSTIWQTQPPIA